MAYLDPDSDTPADVLTPQSSPSPLAPDSASALASAGHDASPMHVHFVDRLGPRVVDFLSAMRDNPQQPAAALFPKEAAAEPNVFYNVDPATGRPDRNSPRSLDQLYGMASKAFQARTAQNGTPPNAASLPPGFDPSRVTTAGKASGATPPGFDPSRVTTAGQVTGSAPKKTPQTPGWLRSSVKAGLDVAGYLGEPELPRAEGVAAGAAENITGAGELFPGSVGDAAAAGTRWLEQQGTKEGRDIGYYGAPLAAGGLSASGMAKDAASGLGGLAKTLGKGIGAGALWGATAPTGKEGWENRILEKATGAAIGAGVGMIPGLAGEAGRIGSGIKSLITGEAGKSAEALRSEMAAAVKNRIDEVERHAKEFGASAEDARAIAQEQEQKIADAQAAADKIAADQAAMPTMPGKGFGARIRVAANDMYAKYNKIRRDQAGFAKALSDAGDAPIVSTKGVEDYIDSVLPKISSDSTKSILENIKSKLRTNITTDGPPVTARAVPLSFADSLRKEIDKGVYRKEMAVKTASMGVDAEAKYYLARVRGLLTLEAGKASPAYKQALAKFRALSRPLDPFERRGPLRGMVDTDYLSGDLKMDEAKVVGALIQKGASGALVKLFEEDPSLKDSARLYFANELFGPDGAKRQLNAENMGAFLRKNYQNLKDTGLLDEFSTLKDARKSAEDAVERAQKERDAGPSESEIGKDVTNAEKSANEATEFKLHMEDLEKAPPKKVADVALGIAKDMASPEKGIISPEKYGEIVKQINDVKAKYGETDETKKLIRNIVIILATEAGVEFISHRIRLP